MNQFNASNVKNYFPNWPKIGNNEKTLEKIKCAKIPLRRIPDKRYNQNSSFTTVETKAADKKICKLLNKLFISWTRGDASPQFLWSPKNDESYWLTSNLKSLNESIEHIHFNMYDLKDTLKMVGKNCFNFQFKKIFGSPTSIDITYGTDKYIISVSSFSSSKYLTPSSKIVRGRLFDWGTYSKGKRSFKKIRYVDDIYLQYVSRRKCSTNIIDTSSQLRSLGFTIHVNKS